LTPELFIEALLEKAYSLNEGIAQIKILAYPEQKRINVYASGEIGKVKAIIEPEAFHIKVTICNNRNDLDKIDKFKEELLSLISLQNQEYYVKQQIKTPKTSCNTPLSSFFTQKQNHKPI
jgi:hypothetical protein